jgi:hypothetical protein
MAATPRRDYRAAQKRIAKRLADIDFALPGSVALRGNRCGKPGCRCKADPPQLHGPYVVWTRKVDGKTVTKMLSKEQEDRYRSWFDNARKLRELVTELHALSIEALQDAEGWEK